MLNLKIVRNDNAKQFPLIGIKKDGDVGMDLPCTLDKEVVLYPGCRYLIPTGIKLEIPKGYWASIEARSSTSKQSLIVPKGIIDEGYRGELFAQVINVGLKEVYINNGDRLIQLVLHKRYSSEFTIEEVDELSQSQRGESGFGSTGK